VIFTNIISATETIDMEKPAFLRGIVLYIIKKKFR